MNLPQFPLLWIDPNQPHIDEMNMDNSCSENYETILGQGDERRDDAMAEPKEGMA